MDDALKAELIAAVKRAAKICDTAFGVLLSEGWDAITIQGYLTARDDFKALAAKAEGR